MSKRECVSKENAKMIEKVCASRLERKKVDEAHGRRVRTEKESDLS